MGLPRSRRPLFHDGFTRPQLIWAVCFFGWPVVILQGATKGNGDPLGIGIVVTATVGLCAWTIWYLLLPVRES